MRFLFKYTTLRKMRILGRSLSMKIRKLHLCRQYSYVRHTLKELQNNSDALAVAYKNNTINESKTNLFNRLRLTRKFE